MGASILYPPRESYEHIRTKQETYIKHIRKNEQYMNIYIYMLYIYIYIYVSFSLSLYIYIYTYVCVHSSLEAL